MDAAEVLPTASTVPEIDTVPVGPVVNVELPVGNGGTLAVAELRDDGDVPALVGTISPDVDPDPLGVS
jgi:hypothetical protein